MIWIESVEQKVFRHHIIAIDAGPRRFMETINNLGLTDYLRTNNIEYKQDAYKSGLYKSSITVKCTPNQFNDMANLCKGKSRRSYNALYI